MMLAVEQRYYKSVASLETDQQDYTIANGEILNLREIGGNGNGANTTRVEIIWDPDGENTLIFATNGSIAQSTILQFMGDGSKVLRIKLINNDVSSRTIGGYYVGEQG